MQPFSKQLFLASCLLTLACHPSHAQGAEKTKPWPRIHQPRGAAKILKVQDGDSTKPFIYHTQHFALHSPEALSSRHLKKFAQVAESVPVVLARFPIPLLAMPGNGRAKVLIYPDEESFVQAGGTRGAGGYYSGRKSAIMLRADAFLKPPPPAGSKLPPKADYDLLVHEFVHLCMHHKMPYLPVWFTEGVAEYFAAAHENNGVYRFDQINSSIRDRIRHHLPNDRPVYQLPPLEETLALTHKTWRQRIELSPDGNGYRMYATSTLLVHTLFHGGEKRRAAIRDVLSHSKPRSNLTTKLAALFPSDERPALQERIVKYWHPRGLQIKFTSTPD